MQAIQQPFVQILEDGKIRYRFNIFSKKSENGGDYYIPGFNLFFSAQNSEISTQRAKNIMTAFFDLWLRDQGPKQFFLQLHKLGFRSPNHDFVMHEVLGRKPIRTKFSSRIPITPAGFGDSIELEEEIAMAM